MLPKDGQGQVYLVVEQLEMLSQEPVAVNQVHLQGVRTLEQVLLEQVQC